MVRRIAAALMTSIFILGLAGSLSGCNTVEGAGKDIERGGEKIQNKAEEHK